MGRGRAPCCDKSKVKKGPWSPAEDLRLITFIQKHGYGNWRALPKQAGLLRCGKSCRLRWINYLRPDLKRGNFTLEEEETIINLHNSWGNKWSRIASQMPGRTDNEIKNVWNTHLKKRRPIIKDADHNHRDKNECEPSFLQYSSPSLSSNSSNQDMQRAYLYNEKGYRDFASETERPNEEQPLNLKAKRSTLTTNNEPKRASNSCSSSSCSSSTCSYGTNQQIFDQVIEIPLESDADLWSMLGLDKLDNLQSSNEAQQNECEASQRGSNFDGQLECRKWLRYFEHELGLVPVGRTNSNYDQVNQSSTKNAGATAALVTETVTDDIEMILTTPFEIK